VKNAARSKEDREKAIKRLITSFPSEVQPLLSIQSVHEYRVHVNVIQTRLSPSPYSYIQTST